MTSINNKTNTIICGDTVFLEIDSVLPTWNYYCFELPVDTPGTKLLGSSEHRFPCVRGTRAHSIIKTEEEVVKNHDGIKFEEEDTVIEKDESEDSSDKQIEMEEGEELDGVLTGLYHKCLATPCVHLSCRVGNPVPATQDILRTQKCPWKHIVRPFEASEIPQRVAKHEATREKRWKFEEEYYL
ncbi:hypothetical protein BDR07DRAFT_1379300 [Suillus spraguei]|nr:hypothetical protein BDR07DRAFT_1379300 [Suillus spraguei]